MTHDETTTEIEIPIKKPDTNIVRVDFARQAPVATVQQRLVPPPLPAQPQAVALPVRTSKQWFRDLDVGAPWILRLIAVAMIIALSLLIL